MKALYRGKFDFPGHNVIHSFQIDAPAHPAHLANVSLPEGADLETAIRRTARAFEEHPGGCPMCHAPLRVQKLLHTCTGPGCGWEWVRPPQLTEAL